MFNKKKILLEKIAQLEKLINTGDFLTPKMIQKIADFKANVVRTNFDRYNEDVDEAKYRSLLDEIRENDIPNEFAWDYWMLLDQTTDYWIGRYSEFEETEQYTKNAILTCLRIGIKFGVAGIEKATGIPYYINFAKNEGLYYCYSADQMLDYNNKPFNKTIINGNKHYTVNDKLISIKTLKPDEVIIYCRRSNKIGDFLWYMKDLLTHIFNMYCISNAMLAVSPKLLCTTDGANNEAAIENCKRLINPFKSVKLIVSNESFITGSSKSNIGQFEIYKNDQYKVAGTDEMIKIMKVHFEEFCNKNGIPITSSKEQSLSSDANLSTFTANCRTKALDNHVLDFFKQLGIKLNIDEPETTSQNDNADKEGKGIANTDGDLND